MAITLNGTTGISSPGGDTSTSLATTNLSYTGTLTGGTGVIAIGTNQIYKDASGNLGIGTASPAALLHLSSGSGTKAIWGTTRNFTVNRNWQVSVDEYSEGQFAITPSTTLGGTTFTTPAIRLDASGNLGLGVTPSAWATNAKAFSLGGSGSGIQGSIANSGTTNAISLISNAYYNAGWKYVYTGSSYPAGRYDIEGNQHSWYTAASGTAGNAITFNQAMTLDASGLGIGQTSVVNRLDVLSSGSYSAVVDMTTAQMRLKHATFPVQLYAGLDHVNRFAYMQASETGVGYRDLLLQPAGGNLLVGTTGVINLGLANFYSATNAKRCIETKINTTATSDHIAFFSSSGQAGQITVTGTTTAYGTGSDYRLKENIKPLQNALSRVALLKPSKYIWKADQSEGEGFIAHELQEVVPQAVTGEKDGEQMQGVDYGKLTPLLTAAIQELTTRLEALEAK